MTNIAPIAPSSSIFSYYAYSNGELSETPLKTRYEAKAALTVEVRIALTRHPQQHAGRRRWSAPQDPGQRLAAPHPALLQ